MYDITLTRAGQAVAQRAQVPYTQGLCVASLSMKCVVSHGKGDLLSALKLYLYLILRYLTNKAARILNLHSGILKLRDRRCGSP